MEKYVDKHLYTVYSIIIWYLQMEIKIILYCIADDAYTNIDLLHCE